MKEGLLRIKRSVFRGCSALTEIVLPNTLTDMGSGVFMNCNELVLPDSLISIGNGTFNGCTSLKQITYNKKLNGNLKKFSAAIDTALKKLSEIKF